MAVRHVDVTFSASPTVQQHQKILSLVLQNVTDFSAYTEDPVLRSFFSANNTVTVLAYGDNLPVEIAKEIANPQATTLKIGNLYHTVQVSGTGLILYSSLEADTFIFPGEARTSYQVGASLNLTPSVMNTMTRVTALSYTIRISESYIAYAQLNLFISNQRTIESALYCKTDDQLCFVATSNYWKEGTADGVQAVFPAVLYPANMLDTNKPYTVSLVTNYGPSFDSSEYYSPGLNGVNANFLRNGQVIPYSIPVEGDIDRKPVMQFKLYDMNKNAAFDVSGIHSVLMLAYNKDSDYASIVTNGGTDYRAVGSFLFAS